VRAVGFGDVAAAQQKAAVGIGEGERVATLAVAAQEPAFEIGAPDVIGRLRVRQWRGVGQSASPLRAGLGETFAAQQIANSAACRPGEIGVQALEASLEFLRSPGGVLGTHFQNAGSQGFG